MNPTISVLTKQEFEALGYTSVSQTEIDLPQHLRRELWRSMSAAKQRALLDQMSPAQTRKIRESWHFQSRDSQLSPHQPWQTWLLLGGRGSGKTRAAAEWVREMMEAQLCHRMALIGPTFADVRDVMIEGDSGLLAISTYGGRPKFEVSRRRLTWPNGGMALVFSAEDPDSMRGPQFDGAWGDEIAAWSKPEAVLDTLRPALRLGSDPRLVLSTTPRPTPVLKSLVADPMCAVTRAATRDNQDNLSPGFVAHLEARWAGTVWARQELDGDIIEDPQGALWTRQDIADARRREGDQSVKIDRIVVAVDPPISAGAKADTCGIIVAGAGGEGRNRKAVILADMSVQGALPQGWSDVVARAYEQFSANLIVAEANQGGEMVRSTLALAAPDAPIRLVHASIGKRARAEPIALLYAQGRVSHAAHFRDLEDQMCGFGAAGFSGSPDRVDALVWALTDLILDRTHAPSARSL